MRPPIRGFTHLMLAVLTALPAAGKPPDKMPAYRVDADGFGASRADIRAVCSSAGMTLWQNFPGYPLEPMRVQRGRHGPISLFKRNAKGEIVLKLVTGDTYWCQYAYQFSHEFCHVLCGYKEGYRKHKWFEETLCETTWLHKPGTL